MTSNQKSQVAVVLGGLASHRRLAAQLKSRGYRIILVDPKERPAIVDAVDVHERVNAIDPIAVAEVAKRHHASLVITGCLDPCVPVMAEVSSELGLPSYLTPESAHVATDKVAMKAAFDRSGVPTAKWKLVSADGLDQVRELRYPVIAKSPRGYGSIGMTIVDSPDQLAHIFKPDWYGAVPDEVLVEEFVHGLEVSIDCIVQEGRAHVLMIRDRHTTRLAHEGLLQCQGTVTPSILPRQIQVELHVVAQSVAAATALWNSPLMLQAIVDESSRVWVLEAAARISGGISGTRTVKLKTGVDLVELSIACALSEPFTVRSTIDPRHFASGSIYGAGGTIAKFEGLSEVARDPAFLYVEQYKMVGDTLAELVSSRQRIAGFIVAANSREELKAAVQRQFDTIAVEEVSGRSLVRQDIGLHHTL